MIPGFPPVAETSIARFPPSPANPFGIKYRLQLFHLETGEPLVRYDIHHGKGHHRHFLQQERTYSWRGVEALFSDFRRDIQRVKKMLAKEKR